MKVRVLTCTGILGVLVRVVVVVVVVIVVRVVVAGVVGLVLVAMVAPSHLSHVRAQFSPIHVIHWGVVQNPCLPHPAQLLPNARLSRIED